MNKGNRYSQIQNGIVNSIINDKTFINTKFSNLEKHNRRINKIKAYEESH